MHARVRPLALRYKPLSDSEKLKLILDFQRVRTYGEVKYTYCLTVSERGDHYPMLMTIELPGPNRDSFVGLIKLGSVVRQKSTGDMGVVFEFREHARIQIRWFDGKVDDCSVCRFTNGELEIEPIGVYGGESKLLK